MIKMEIPKDKFILDACCGPRMFWFNKQHPNTVFMDIRTMEKGTIVSRPNRCVEPDLIADFKNMPFEDKTFKLVVFDPPHIFFGEKSYMAKTYGRLEKETWKDEIKKGFDECWRVLDDWGTLIFKWNEWDIKKKEVLEVIGKEPLFGHPPLSKTKTHWMCFLKIPKELKEHKEVA